MVDDLARVRLPHVDDRQSLVVTRPDLGGDERMAVAPVSGAGAHRSPPRRAGTGAARRAPSRSAGRGACGGGTGTGWPSTEVGTAGGSGGALSSRSLNLRVSSNRRATATTGGGSADGEGGGAGGR